MVIIMGKVQAQMTRPIDCVRNWALFCHLEFEVRKNEVQIETSIERN